MIRQLQQATAVGWLIGVGVCMLIAVCSGVVAAEDRSSADGAARTDLAFRLVSANGQAVELTRGSSRQFTVVCFLGAECPLARLYGPRLSALEQQFSPRGVRFIGINSNRQDSPDDVRHFVRDCGISFPVVKDPGNQVADAFGAQRTPEAFVVDETLTIRYQGRIDDQYEPGVSRSQPSRHDLRMALDDLTAEASVRVARTEACGCLIGRVKRTASDERVTYCNQVARILNQHCIECHREGEIGPFSMTNYDELIGWGEAIVESIQTGRMPPWHADPQHGKFANARFMPESDQRLVQDWVAAGMPYGDAALLPPTKTDQKQWQLPREPDLIVKMGARPFTIPANGTVDYQYFVVDPKFTEDRWVSAAQVIPGNRSVVHHCLVFIRPPDGVHSRGVGWLTAYVPGQRSASMPAGRARRVPAGSKFVFQMHYTPNGVEQTDLTQVGMTFASATEVTHEVFSLIALEQDFEIPPQTADFPVTARVPWLPPRGELLAIAPHMHLRGQSFRAVSRRNGRDEILLNVPRYDFNWQHVYELSTPLRLADVEAIEFTAKFDNSRTNPVNPDPTQTVTWGDQTWEEMAVAFFEVAEPLEPADATPQVKESPATESTSQEQTAKVAAFVRRFFERHDRDRDGLIERSETSLVFREYGFSAVDINGDGRITREEVEAVARQRHPRQ